MRFGFIFFILFGAKVVIAGDTLHTDYIRKFTDHFSISAITKQKNFDFTLRSREGPGNLRRSFYPNNTYSAGIGLFIFDVNLELTAGIPSSQRRTERFGETKTRDLQLNLITHKIGVELYRQSYEGFYVTDPDVSISAPQPYPTRPDLTSRNTGYSMIYVFNPSKYSLPSTYTFAEQQLRSSGSFIMQTSLSSWSMSVDSALIGSHLRDTFGTGASLLNGRFTSIDIGPGYVHNIVFNGFFLNLSFFVAPSHTWIKYTEVNRAERFDIQINLSGGVRAAVGYNSDTFFTGLSLANQSKIISLNETELINNRSAIKLVVGYRFRERGFLQKSAIDLLPAALHHR